MAKTQIYQQEEALSVYFRDMLAEPAKAKPAPPQQAESEPLADEPIPTETPTTEIDKPEAEAVQESLPAEQEVIETDTSLKLLLCEIGGIKLALNVAELNNIVHWPAQGLHQLPGRADWQLGLFTERDQQVEVVDMAPFLQAPETGGPSQPGYILLVDERRLGIACDGIERIITIDADAVNWRSDRDQRPWFSGVIADSMHHIIDLPALLSALDAGEMA